MAYDEIGRQDAVYLPTGTIDRTVFDDLGRVVSAWVGTSDTHTGDDWTPATNTGNMIDVENPKRCSLGCKVRFPLFPRHVIHLGC